MIFWNREWVRLIEKKNSVSSKIDPIGGLHPKELCPETAKRKQQRKINFALFSC